MRDRILEEAKVIGNQCGNRGIASKDAERGHCKGVSQSTWRDAGRCRVDGDGNMEFSSASGS